MPSRSNTDSRKLILPIVVLAALTVLAPSRCPAQTVEEIVAKAIEARGGLNKIHSVRAQRQTGTISFGPDNQGPLIVTQVRGDGFFKMCEDVRLPGQTMFRTTLGKSGWKTTGGNAQGLSDEDLHNMEGGADFDGPLVDSTAKGVRIAYAGKAQIEGKDTFKLVITMKSGEIRNDYIDCATHLESKWEGRLKFDGKEFDVETYFRDYRKVDGLMYSFLLESNTLGTPIRQKIVWNKIEVNPKIDNRDFERPDGK